MQNRTMGQLARERPTTQRNLLTVHGLAEQKVRDYGAALTSLIKRASLELGLATDLNPAGGGARANATSSSSRTSDVSEHSVDLNSPGQKPPSGRALPWSNHAKGSSGSGSSSSSGSEQKQSFGKPSFVNDNQSDHILGANSGSRMLSSATNRHGRLAVMKSKHQPHGPVSQIDASDEDQSDSEGRKGESLCRRVSNECDDYGGESILTPQEEATIRAAAEQATGWLERSDTGWMERSMSTGGPHEVTALKNKKQRCEYEKQQQRVGALPWANGSSSSAVPSKAGNSSARVSTGDVSVKSFFTPQSSKQQSPSANGRASEVNGFNCSSNGSNIGSRNSGSSSTAPASRCNTNGDGITNNDSNNNCSSSVGSNSIISNSSGSSSIKRSRAATSDATATAIAPAITSSYKSTPKARRFGGLDDLAGDSDSDESSIEGNVNSNSNSGSGSTLSRSRHPRINSSGQKHTPMMARRTPPSSNLAAADASTDDDEDPDDEMRASLEAAIEAGMAARDFLKCASLQKRIDALDAAKVKAARIEWIKIRDARRGTFCIYFTSTSIVFGSSRI